jgi:hypothetical protein
MDVVSGAENISQLFANQYKALFQSVATPMHELLDIELQIDSQIRGTRENDLQFSAEDVCKGIKNLKANKSDGEHLFMSDHLINGGAALHAALSCLFNCILSHGFVPSVLLASVMISIPKNRKASLCNSSNYRSIALSSSICKLIDVIVLSKCSHALKTSELQFGFKSDHSPVLCTAILKEVVQHYVNRKSNVYALFLDASKAFDKVHFGKLFKLLLRRNLNPLIARMLFYMYRNQSARVKWNGSRSESFSMLNGVKQGGVLSPVLFTIYFDELLSILKNVGVGCHVEDAFAGALSFADDLTLLSPSLSGLNRMVKLCELYAKSFDVTFNEAKTVALYFSHANNVTGHVELNGCKINWSDQVKHLGNYICTTLDDDPDCKYKTSCFIGSSNKVIANFGYLCIATKWKLFTAYCTSYYGSQMWNLSCKYLPHLYIQWNKAVRRLMHLPARTHTWMLGPLHNSLHIRVQLEIRTLNFIWKCLSHSNHLVQSVFNVAKFDARTPVGANIAHFRALYGICTEHDISYCTAKIKRLNALTIEQEALVSVAKDLIGCRDNILYISSIENSIITSLLQPILCN